MADTSLRQLIRDAFTDVSNIVRDTIQLAKAELSANGKRIGAGIGLFAAGAFLGLVALLLIVIAIAQFLIWLGLVAWIAYLIDAAFFLLVMAVLFLAGKHQFSAMTGFAKTGAAVKGTVEALKKQ